MRSLWREFVEFWRVLVLGAFIAELLLSPEVAAAAKMAGLAAQIQRSAAAANAAAPCRPRVRATTSAAESMASARAPSNRGDRDMETLQEQAGTSPHDTAGSSFRRDEISSISDDPSAGSGRWLADLIMLGDPGGETSPAAQPKSGVDPLEMIADGRFLEHQLVGDLAIGQAEFAAKSLRTGWR